MKDDVPMSLRRGADRQAAIKRAEAVAAQETIPPPSKMPRQVMLVGGAKSKEIVWKNLNPATQRNFYEAMKTEWAKWQAWKATRSLSKEDLKNYPPDQRIVGTRWVLTYKGDGKARARLVVQGCQEKTDHIRGDAPTATRDAMMMVFAYGSKDLGN